MVSGEQAALESLRKNFENSMKEHDLAEAATLKRAEAATAKLADVEEKAVNARMKSIGEDLPSPGRVKLALYIAGFADLVGVIVAILSFIPLIGVGFAWAGIGLDFITVFLITVLLGGPKKEFLAFLPEFSEALTLPVIRQIGAIAQALPFYFMAVKKFWDDNKEEYGEWSELKKANIELKGIFSGPKVGFSGFRVPQAITSSSAPLVLLLCVMLAGCGLTSTFASDLDSINPVGVAVVNVIPWAKAYKDSGQGDQFRDFQTVNVQTELSNWNPFRVFWNYYNQSVSRAGGNYYTTTIEDAQDQDLGLYIGDINTLAINQKPNDIRFSFAVTGKTFTKSNLTARTFCEIQKPGIITDNKFIGEAKPPSFVMRKDIPVYNIVTCTVKSGQMEAGFYQAVAGIVYPFEVWSYIPYSFVSIDTYNSYGSDINSRLGIDRQTKSLSTNGPMVLAISQIQQGQVPQPYPINKDVSTYLPIDFKLEDNANGKLKDLAYVILQVPKEVTPDCFAPAGKVKINDDDTKRKLALGLSGEDSAFLESYSFIEFYDFGDASKLKSPISFTCSLELKPEDVESFLSGGAVTRKTIVATAGYTYQVERRKVLEVQELPGVVS